MEARPGVEAIGANGPPSLDLADADIDGRAILIAGRALKIVCAALGGIEIEMVLLKKAGGEYMQVRNLWLWAMRPHISRVELAAITRLNEKTITQYCKQLETHIERNGLLAGFCDMIADMVEPLPGIIDDGAEALADMAVEAAIDRVRKSVDGLRR